MRSVRIRVRFGVGILVVAGGLAGTGCSSSLFSIVTFRGRRGFDEAALVQVARRKTQGPASKAQVLAALGPPVEVLVQSDGEVFVYRRHARDAATLSLTPGAVLPAPSIPIYYASEVSGRDDLVMVFFDANGRVRGISARSGIGVVEGSKAATLGEMFEGALR